MVVESENVFVLGKELNKLLPILGLVESFTDTFDLEVLILKDEITLIGNSQFIELLKLS